MSENRTDMNSIYDEVIAHYGWGDYVDSKKRLLRKKYAFLQKNLVLCDPEDFKVKGANFVPNNDAPIIRELLIAAVDDSEKNKMWGNGVALPCVFFVLSGIAWVLNGNEE